jgi:adenylate cyclase
VLALPDKPSIAVLPFTNMSGDPEQEYFADGMVEEIIGIEGRCKKPSKKPYSLRLSRGGAAR